MANKLWTPQNGSTEWHNAANWEPNGIPAPADEITINSLAEVNQGVNTALGFKLTIGQLGTLMIKASEIWNFGAERFDNVQPAEYPRIPTIVNNGRIIASIAPHTVRVFVLLENNGQMMVTTGAIAIIIPVRSATPESTSNGTMIGSGDTSISLSGSFNFGARSSLVADGLYFNTWGDQIGDSKVMGTFVARTLGVMRRKVTFIGHAFDVGKIILRDPDAQTEFKAA